MPLTPKGSAPKGAWHQPFPPAAGNVRACIASRAFHHETWLKPTSSKSISSEIGGALVRNQRKGLLKDRNHGACVIYYFCFSFNNLFPVKCLCRIARGRLINAIKNSEGDICYAYL